MKPGYQTSWQTPALTLQAYPPRLAGFFMPGAETGDEWNDDDASAMDL
jgi:hypothetical protein